MTYVDRLRRLAVVIGALEKMQTFAEGRRGGSGLLAPVVTFTVHPAFETADADEISVLAAFTRALGPVLETMVDDMRAHALASTAHWLGWLLEGVAGEVGSPPPDDVAELILRIASIGARFGGIAPS